jgi:hypothetical protein
METFKASFYAEKKNPPRHLFSQLYLATYQSAFPSCSHIPKQKNPVLPPRMKKERDNYP